VSTPKHAELTHDLTHGCVAEIMQSMSGWSSGSGCCFCIRGRHVLPEHGHIQDHTVLIDNTRTTLALLSCCVVSLVELLCCCCCMLLLFNCHCIQSAK
jgi:hypothetical protein